VAYEPPGSGVHSKHAKTQSGQRRKEEGEIGKASLCLCPPLRLGVNYYSLRKFFKQERYQPGQLVLIGIVPPLAEIPDRETMLSCATCEVRKVMHERLNLNRFLPALEIGFGPLVLSERMKFADEKLATCHQRAMGLRKDDCQVANMFQHQVTDNQVDGFSFTRPGLSQIGYGEQYMVGTYFTFRLFEHTH
jgi:hypothetical protein